MGEQDEILGAFGSKIDLLTEQHESDRHSKSIQVKFYLAYFYNKSIHRIHKAWSEHGVEAF